MRPAFWSGRLLKLILLFYTYVCNVRERVKLHLSNYFAWLVRLRDLEEVTVVDEHVILVVSFAWHKQHLNHCE